MSELAFGFLEDSGYLPRIAVLTNGAFSKIGLNGKAVLPMVLGLGCGTMATMTTRILETKRERLIATFLIALAIPCSAQLGVILGMLWPLFHKGPSLVGSHSHSCAPPCRNPSPPGYCLETRQTFFSKYLLYACPAWEIFS